MARSHADAFLEAILQDPDDDTPRLVYADWLEEQGDSESAARAEFIRVQCAVARERPGRGPAGRELYLRRITELHQREQQFLDEYGNEWARPVRRQVHSWKFHRGFIDEIVIWDDVFLAHADRLFRRVPIQHLHLRPQYIGMPRPIAALADNEHLRRLRSLDLSWQFLESRHVRALVVSEHLAGLTTLDLSRNRIGDSGIQALAEAPLLAQLTHLDLQGNLFGTRGLRALAESLERLAGTSSGLRLKMLGVQNNKFSAAGRRLLADSPLLKRLVH